MFEYSSSVEPAVMVVRGVLHGCIGVCCSAKYPSVFANIGDKEIWDFVQEKAIKIDVDHMGKNQNQDGNDEEGKNVNQIVDQTEKKPKNLVVLMKKKPTFRIFRFFDDLLKQKKTPKGKTIVKPRLNSPNAKY